MNAIVGLAEVYIPHQPHPALLFIADAVGEDATGEALLALFQMNQVASVILRLRSIKNNRKSGYIGSILADKDALVARCRNCS